MTPARRDLPSGTVTFLFTDVEGSTKLLHRQGDEMYAAALAEHRRLLRSAFEAHGGFEVDTQGDAFFFAFPTAPAAVRAAAEAMELLARGPIRVRAGIHTGTPHVTEEGYVGVDVHRAARIAACGHGGQILISASTAALVGSSSLRDLGEHRLKDLSAPERIYQLGHKDFPPLRSLHQTNLPIPATTFVGREKEVADVVTTLSREDVRLLTLTGPGGTGKTRLALQTAAEIAERYEHGVWWVPLAPLRDARLVLPAAGQIVGAKNGLADYISDKSLLLLFDNFEQVIEAATSIADLLAACPKLDLLVTSREPLHLSGEHEYAVPPLRQDEGVDLFLARARAQRPELRIDHAVSEICRRLDNLPLALELAAARVKSLSAEQILERLERRLPLLTGGARDLPERQRTLRAAIAWSEELLTPEERGLFARLAIFRGGCTLEAAEAVAEADLDTLQSLVDKSLLRHADGRFSMLETIREYAAERLDTSREVDALRRRHAEHFLALAEEGEPNLREGTKAWLDRLEREHDNIRAALEALEALGEREQVLRLAGAMSRFWYLRGYLLEGQRRLEDALRADERPTPARAKALNGGAVMTFNTGDLATAKQRAEAALALHRDLGDAWGAAYAAFMLGNIADGQGDKDKARQLFEESVRDFRSLGDEHYELIATSNLAWIYSQLGDAERARALHEETLAQARARRNTRVEANALGNLAMVLVDKGLLEDGLSMAREALRIQHSLGDLLWIAVDLRRIAYALVLSGDAVRATWLVSKAVALLDEIGARQGWIQEANEKALTAIHSKLEETAFAEAWERGRALTLDEAVALALDRAD